ncbi:MAG: preprotein translocase subunit SecY, partial [Eubacteriales bacterium]|nr:preprotein translocase subunit SecY [Eubacteriales bacterium]
MGGMLETLRNAWRIKELRRKILFTVMMLIVFRIGSHIPVPYLDPGEFAALVQSGSLFQFLNIVSGGAFSMATIFAMSIQPYINSSIIMNLLTVAIPKLEKLAKEGEEGRKVIAKYTRFGTVILAFLQAGGL